MKFEGGNILSNENTVQNGGAIYYQVATPVCVHFVYVPVVLCHN